MKILVTGFDRFGKLDFNPTELMMGDVRRFAQSTSGCEVIAEVLPTEFERAGRRIGELLDTHDPDAVLGFGVSRRAETFLLERFAVNIDDAKEADNAGCAPPGRPIVPGGPAAHGSTLPLAQIYSSLQEAAVPVAYSNHAGTFVCNHVFYLICHHPTVATRSRLSGFIHVPLEAIAPDSSPKASAAKTVAGVLASIEAVRKFLEEQRAELA